MQGHNGSVKVNKSEHDDGERKVDTSTLEIRVLIDGSKEKGKVKDLKQLSGTLQLPFCGSGGWNDSPLEKFTPAFRACWYFPSILSLMCASAEIPQ